jgi:hypothetical protein
MIKKKVGRPGKVYTEQEIAMIGRYAGLGANMKQMAYLAGRKNADYFGEDLNKFPALREAIELGRASAAIAVMSTAYEMAVSGNHPAMTAFWLKTRCNWREAKEPLPEDADKDAKIKALPTSELIALVKSKVG